MHIDMSTLSPAQAYAMMTQTVIPRPIAWILTGNSDNTYNLAPFSYFNALASDPPIVGKDAKGRVCVNAVDVDPLGRLGGGEYFGAGDLIYVERPA